MAEFCSQCDPVGRDYDLVQIALELECGHSTNILCEGCTIQGIYKDEIGLIYLADKVNGETQLELIKIEELL